MKGSRNSTKQTVQLKYKDIIIFCKNDRGKLRWLPPNASDSLIATANGATLKLDNKKIGWKGGCVYYKAYSDDTHWLIQTLGQCYLHVQCHGATAKTFLLAYFNKAGQHFDITNQDVISAVLKLAATFLDWPTTKGIPINRIDTHLLRSSGANALLLAGYSNIKIQKMGRWHGATSKEYIQEELAFFLEGMPCSMKQKLQFANVAGISFNTITDDLISTDYNVNISTE